MSKKEKISNVIDLVIKKLLVIFAFVFPVFFVSNITLQNTIFQKFYFFYICVFFIIILFICRSFLKGIFELKRHRIDIFVLSFLFVSGIGTFLSIDKYHSFFGFLNVPSQTFLSIILLSALYFIINFYADKKLIKNIIIALILSNIIIFIWSILGLMGFLSIPLLKIIPLNLIGSFSSLSAYFIINIPLLIVAFSYSIKLKSRVKRIFGALTFGSLSVCNIVFLYFFLHNYTKWIIFAISIFIFLFLILFGIIKASKKVFYLISVIFIISLIFIFIGEPKNNKVNLPIEVSLSYSQSVDIAKKSIIKNYFFGSGLGTFGRNFSLYKSSEIVASYSPELKLNTPTGALFGVITTQGLFGSVAFLLLIVAGLYLSIKTIIKREARNDIVFFGLGISSLIFVLYSLFYKLDSDVVVYGVFIVILLFSYLVNVTKKEVNFYKIQFSKSKRTISPFVLICFGVGFLSIYLIIVTTRLFLADIDMKSFLKDAKEHNLYGMEYNAKKVISRAHNEGYYTVLMSKNFLDNANFLANRPKDEFDLNSIKKSIEYAINFANYATDKLPNDSIAWKVRGLVYENSGGLYKDALKESTKSYENALKLEPKNVNYLASLSRLKLTQINFISKDDNHKNEKKDKALKEAKDLIIKALKFKNNYAPLYDQLSEVEEISGNIDNAILAQEKALMFSKNNIKYALRLSALCQQRGTEQDLELASSILQKILEHNKNIQIELSLALLSERRGDLNLAKQEYEAILSDLKDKNSKEAKVIEKYLNNVRNGKSNVVVNVKSRDLNESVDQKEVDKKENENKDIEKKERKIVIDLLDGGGKSDVDIYSKVLSEKDNITVKTGDAKSKIYKGITIYYSKKFENYVKGELSDAIKKYTTDITIEENEDVTKKKSADIIVVVGAQK